MKPQAPPAAAPGVQAAALPADTRQDQAQELAAYMAQHPGSTMREMEGAGDFGSVSKLISVMRKEWGFLIDVASDWRVTAAGKRRRCKRYTLKAWPEEWPPQKRQKELPL